MCVPIWASKSVVLVLVLGPHKTRKICFSKQFFQFEDKSLLLGLFLLGSKNNSLSSSNRDSLEIAWLS